MGKSKAGGSQSQSQKREFSLDNDVNVANDNEEDSVYSPASKKRKVDLKHKNGTGSLAAYGASLKVALQKAEQEDDEGEEVPKAPVAKEKSKPAPSSSVVFVDGNCAERIKDKNLCRKRPNVVPFQIDAPKPKPNEVVIGNGNGTKFKDIPFLVQRINNALSAELETIHKVVFGKKGIQSKRKQNLLSFSGFTFALDSKEYSQKRVELIKLEKPDREFVCEWFGLDKSGSKEDAVESILEFLMTPSAGGVNEIVSGSERKSLSPKREPKSPATAASPSKKKSPAKAKASPKKKVVAPKFSKPKQAKKSASPATKARKSNSPKASPKKPNSKIASPKKKAAVKPVFKAKNKKNAKNASAASPEEHEEKEETNEEEISSDTSGKQEQNEEQEVMIQDADSAGSGTKTKKKSSIKKSPKKGKGKMNNAFASQPIEDEEDQDMVSTTSRTQ